MGENERTVDWAARPQGHPPAIWFFFWGEFAERSSYYGMRAILFLYMTTALRYSDTEASPIYAAFKMGCYLLPLARRVARRPLVRPVLDHRRLLRPLRPGPLRPRASRTRSFWATPSGLSPERLAFVANLLLFVSLALLAGGSGVIKPNISSLAGPDVRPEAARPGRLRTSAFLWFYLAINIGALISSSPAGVRDRYIMAAPRPPNPRPGQKPSSTRGTATRSSTGTAGSGRHAYQTRLRLPDRAYGPVAGGLRGREAHLCRREAGGKRLTPGRAAAHWKPALHPRHLRPVRPLLRFRPVRLAPDRLMDTAAEKAAKAVAIGLSSSRWSP